MGRVFTKFNFRKKYNANVLAIWRTRPIRTNFQDLALKANDHLLIQASRKRLDNVRASKDFTHNGQEAIDLYHLENRLLLLALPEGSSLTGKTLAQSELGDAFGLSVLGIIRKGRTRLMPKAKEKLQVGDQLVVEGKLEDVEMLEAIQALEVQDGRIPSVTDLETEEVGLVEAVISPHSRLGGKSLRDLQFREKYGLNILAIWRGGRAYRSNLREMVLREGDSILVYGHRNHIKLMADEDDFLVLSQEIQEAPRRERAFVAVAIMAGVVATAGLGWLPIQIAALAGAAAMVLTRCLNMDEAQKSIRWPAIFLIAGMLPLGIALQNSGTANFLGQQIFANAATWSVAELLAVLFLASNLLAQIVPPAVVAVLVASLILHGSIGTQASPQALLITIAMGSAMPLMSPVGHPANLLVMGPGGYRFSDYIKVGLPLTLVLMLVAVIAVPYFWPAF